MDGNRTDRPSSEPGSAPKDFPPKAPIGHETQARVFEGRWFVVLEKKVPAPSESVALNQRHRDQPPPPRRQSSHEQRDSQACTNEMQPAGDPIGMFAEVIRIEITKGTERPFVAHFWSPERDDASLGS